jgi:hypothetical protein
MLKLLLNNGLKRNSTLQKDRKSVLKGKTKNEEEYDDFDKLKEKRASFV